MATITYKADKEQSEFNNIIELSTDRRIHQSQQSKSYYDKLFCPFNMQVWFFGLGRSFIILDKNCNLIIQLIKPLIRWCHVEMCITAVFSVELDFSRTEINSYIYKKILIGLPPFPSAFIAYVRLCAQLLGMSVKSLCWLGSCFCGFVWGENCLENKSIHSVG